MHLCLSGERDPALRQAQVDMPFDRAQATILRHLVDDLARGIMAVRDAGDYAGHAMGFKHGPFEAEALPVVMRCAGRAWHARGRYGRLLGRAPAMGESLADALGRTRDEIDQLKVIHSGINSLSSFDSSIPRLAASARKRAFLSMLARVAINVVAFMGWLRGLELGLYINMTIEKIGRADSPESVRDPHHTYYITDAII